MVSKRSAYIVAAFVMLTPRIAAAQIDSGLQQDERKLSAIHFGLNDEGPGHPDQASSSNIGRFLNLEKILRNDQSYIDLPGMDDWDYSTRMIVDYYFGSEEWVPMIGLSMGYVQNENENSRFVAGPEIGLKYFMNPSTFLYGLLGYQFLFDNEDAEEDLFYNGRFIYGIGLGVTFSY